jgi:protein-tyrosine phosphatase
VKVLFICTANVCRSPLAEGYLASLNFAYQVSSAGVVALEGMPPFECAMEVARGHGFDISGNKATQLTLEAANEADLILCMETWHVQKVMELDNQLIQKVELLGRYLPGGKKLTQIPDPREFTVPETKRVFARIKKAIDGFVHSGTHRKRPAISHKS